MLSCMVISGNWRTVVRNLAVRVSRRKLRGGMPTSVHRLKAGFERKAPAMNCTAEFWMVSSIASWEGGTKPYIGDPKSRTERIKIW